MATIVTDELAPELVAEMEEVARLAILGGVQDPDHLRRITQRAQSIREDVFRKHGLLDIGTPAIRELRDSDG